VEKTEPIVVVPAVYLLPVVGFWRWCKLGEICDLVPNVAMVAGNTYVPSLEELVRHFAALVRHNVLPKGNSNEKPPGKKMFRYSFGTDLRATEVPNHGRTSTDPPYAPFKLDDPLSREVFVPEGWARDTLRAIHAGAVAAAQFDSQLIGFPAEKDKQFIRLGKARTTKE